MNSALTAWNDAPADVAVEALLSCCGSPLWVATLLEERPFATVDAFLHAAERAWFKLPEPEWLATFACHPRIGESKANTTVNAGSEAASSREQEAAQVSLATVATALAAANSAYEERFGFLFLVFASGRTAPELLAILEQRLQHDRPTELAEAAQQQWLITAQRMHRWLDA